MRITLLGPSGLALSVRQRSLLAALALQPGHVVGSERLIESMWGVDEKPMHVNALHQQVFRLRQALDGIVVSTQGDGYVLEAGPDDVDLHHFRHLVTNARALEDDAAAARLFEAALALWQEEPLADLPAAPPWSDVRAALEEERLEVVEDDLERRLRLGDDVSVALRELSDRYPDRQRLRELQAGVAVEPVHRVVPHQLPRGLPDFTGRESALAELEAIGRTVVITAIDGTAGVGKTALALHHAHRVAEQFPDGQLYANLRGFDPDTPPLPPGDVLVRFLRALGIAGPRIPQRLEQQAELYRMLLRDRRTLVVLDNAASVDQVAPLLPDSDGCRVVITSRNRLAGVDAWPVLLDVMSPEEAIALLRGLLGDAPELPELARLCGYLPLALRIAAANATGAVAELVEDLREEGSRLAALSVDEDERLAVRATLDLSFRTLSSGARELFRKLGAVAGHDFTAEVAALLVAEPELDELVTANLVERQGDRYHLHDLVRLYARGLLTEEETDALRTKLALWHSDSAANASRMCYAADDVLLETAGGRTFDTAAEALAWLDAEKANLVAVAATGPSAWRMADAVHSFFSARRDHVSWTVVREAGLAAARREGEVRGEAAVLGSEAIARMYSGRSSEALVFAHQALELAERENWLPGTLRFLTVIGHVCREIGDIDRSAECYLRVARLSEEAGLPRRQAYALSQIGSTCWLQGRLADAEAHHRRSFAIDQQVGIRSGRSLAELACALRDQGRLDEALVAVEQSLVELRALGQRGLESYVLDDLSAVHREAGRFELALAAGHEALQIALEVNDPGGEVDARHSIGAVLLRMGDPGAEEEYRRAVSVAQRIGYRHGEAQSLAGLGRVTGRAEHLHQALAIARQHGYGLIEGTALTGLASAHLAVDLERALKFAQEAVDLHRRNGCRLGEARSLVVLGHGREGAWEEALAIFAEIGVPEAGDVRALLKRGGSSL
ncbi:tetratricopeptide repeat protein [Lentzea sp. NPDC051213]|uniref:tetratricopeptide repeat protein n=1 Tax=Lentzea sp. NPDC051213 TaxID=3364126 RepID=UPI0037BD7A7D